MWREDRKIRYVYHIGDIHIRNDSERDSEYETVINRFVAEIKTDPKESVVICVGDIFNDTLSSTAIILAKNMAIKICEKCDLIMMRGNHDTVKKGNNDSDNMKAALCWTKTGSTNDIYILEQSGEYKYGDIILGYTDVYNTEVYKLTKTSKCKSIGLWHGMVKGSVRFSNENGRRIIFNKEDFNCYDYVMLGDVHKSQYLDKNKRIGYCGSLIQQDFGESVKDHGYILWDLKEGVSEFKRVKNDFGFVTLVVDDGNIPEIESLPKKIELRVTGKKMNETIENKICEIITKRGIEIKNHHAYDTEPAKKGDIKELEVQADKTVKDVIFEYIDGIDLENIKDERDKIGDVIDETIKELNVDNSKKKVIKIKGLIFNNYNVYGCGNCIDYEKFNGIVNIVGRNGKGKSSMAVDILLFALFGKNSKYDGTSTCINNTRDRIKMMIAIDVNGEEYRIEREFTRNETYGAGHTGKMNVNLYRGESNISKKTDKNTLYGPGTEKLIEEIIGSEEDLINMSIMEQNRAVSFIDMNDKERKNTIKKMMGLDVYEEIINEIKIRIKKLESKIKENKARIKQNNRTRIEFDEIIKKNEEEKKREIKVNKLYDGINARKIEGEMKIKEYMDINYDEEELDKIIKEIDDKKKNYESIKTKNKKISEKISDYRKLDDKERIKKELTMKKELIKKNDKMNELYKEYNTKIKTEIVDSNDKIIDELMKKENELHKQIVEIRKENEKINKIINEYKSDKNNKKKYEKYNESTRRIEKLNDELEKLMIELKKYDGIDNIDGNLNIIREKINYECIKKEIVISDEKINELLEETKEYYDEMINDIEELMTIMNGMNIVTLLNEKKLCYNRKLGKYLNEIEKKANNKKAKKMIALVREKKENDERKKQIREIKYEDTTDEIIKVGGEYYEKDRLSKKIKRIKEEVNEKEKECDENEKWYKIGSNIDMNLDEIVKNEKDIEILTEKIICIQLKIKVETEKKKNYEQNIKVIENNKRLMSDIKKIEKEIKTINDNLKYSQDEHNELEKENNEMLGELNKNKLLISEIEKDLIRLDIEKGKIEDNNEKCEEYLRVKDAMKQIMKEYVEINKERNEIRTNILEMTREIAKYEKELEEKETCVKENDELNEKLKTIKTVHDVLDKGLMNYLIRVKVLPILTKKANEILGEFVNFRVGVQVYGSEIMICKIDENDKMSDARGLSGYEGTMCNIAFRIALNLISRRYKTDFFILDEVFDCCDEQNVNKIQRLFNYIRMVYKYVLVITHNEQVKKYTDQEIEIKIIDGFSHINMVDENNKEKFERYEELLNYHTGGTKEKKIKKITTDNLEKDKKQIINALSLKLKYDKKITK